MRFRLLILSLFICGFANAQVETRNYILDKKLAPVPHTVDMEHLKLEASFEPEKGLIRGKVEHQFTVLRKEIDSLVLNAVKIRCSLAKLNGKEIRYKSGPKTLTLYFDHTLSWKTKHTLEIIYEANPRKGLYFIGWNDETGRSRKQMWTQGQGIDNRHWIPMYDEQNDKLTTEMLIEFAPEYMVLSNGERIKVKTLKNGNKLWHYKMSKPHATYLIMLGIGKYEIEKRKSASGVNMELYYYADQAEQMEPTYRHSVEMFDFFEKEIGVPYPWENYAQIPVQDFMYGAMENTTATLFGDFYLIDERGFLDRNYVRVNAHELAHQWFGDMVTARSSAHHWLQESFATHYDMVYSGEAFGQDHFDWTRRNYNNQAVAETKKNYLPIAHSEAGSVRHYPKGAFILQMLKYVVGREQYNEAIKYYLRKHSYANVGSQDLLNAFHESLGLSLDWFWEDWVLRGGEPAYEVNFQQFNTEGVFAIKQVHEQNEVVDLFRIPIVFEIHYKDGSSSSKKVMIEKQFEEVRFNLEQGKEISYVLFDPNNEVMKSFSFSKSTEMLLEQAVAAEHMLDRYDAIVALSSRRFESKDEFLIERFKAETFHGVKGEIIKQLMPQMNEASLAITKLALEDEDAEVRKAILNSTVRISAEMEPLYRSLLMDKSYAVIEKTLDILSFYYPQNLDQYLQLTKEVVGDRSHNVRIQWLKQAYFQKQDETYLSELIDYCSNSYEFLTRVKAAETLKELNVLNEKALAHLLDARFSFNRRLAGPVKNVIDHFFEQAEYKKLILAYVSNREWGEIEFRRVRNYMVP